MKRLVNHDPGYRGCAKHLPQNSPGDARRGEAGVPPKPCDGRAPSGAGVGWELRVTDGLSAADGDSGLREAGGFAPGASLPS